MTFGAAAAAEKDHTRRSDELARQRQELPWVRVDKDDRFQSEDGEVSLADLPHGGTTDDPYDPGESPGVSAFVLDDGVVFHTYSAYERGIDTLWGMYQWLDRTPRGRNERRRQPWFRRHDEYGDDED